MPTIEDLRNYFSYDPETGVLRTAPNGRVVGYEKKTGYSWVNFRQKQYRIHRIIWMIVHGEIPDQIDHINGNRSDNRLSNLRNVTKHQNSLNHRLRPDNKSGCPGVNWHAKGRRWIAQIRDSGRYVYLGSFSELGNAIKARKDAEILLGYHENHGALRERYLRD